MYRLAEGEQHFPNCSTLSASDAFFTKNLAILALALMLVIFDDKKFYEVIYIIARRSSENVARQHLGA